MNEVALDIIKNANDFYLNMQQNPLSNDYSWEFCYWRFYQVLKGNNPNEYSDDDLALNLAFYLASWGMYRGSSFLTQMNYKVHIEAVNIIKKYANLFALDYDHYFENAERLDALIKELQDYYFEIRKSVPEKNNISSGISDTLISKILIGTLGCIPAYDRYFIDAVIKKQVTTGVLNRNSISKLFIFYKENEAEFEKARKGMIIHGTKLQYPQMKLIDMGLWNIGFKASNN